MKETSTAKRWAGLASVASLTLGVLSIGTPAAADAKDGRFAVEEAGRVSCADLVKAREAKSPIYGRYVGFIEGYLTAANRYEPNTFDLSPWHSTSVFAVIVDKHCRKQPKDSLVTVAQRLVSSFASIRLAEFSNLVQAGDAGHRTFVYETILKRAQGALTRKGLYRGAADGRDTPEFRAALKQFQQAEKLNPSGSPDSATLWALFNP